MTAAELANKLQEVVNNSGLVDNVGSKKAPQIEADFGTVSEALGRVLGRTLGIAFLGTQYQGGEGEDATARLLENTITSSQAEMQNTVMAFGDIMDSLAAKKKSN